MITGKVSSCLAVLAVLILLPGTAAAAGGEFAPPGYPGKDDSTRRGAARFERLAEALDLSSSQRERIRTIQEQERERMAALREKVREERQEVRRVKETGLGEDRLRAAAREQADARVDLLLAREGVRERVLNVLTSAQRERAEKFRQQRHSRGSGAEGRLFPRRR